SITTVGSINSRVSRDIGSNLNFPVVLPRPHPPSACSSVTGSGVRRAGGRYEVFPHRHYPHSPLELGVREHIFVLPPIISFYRRGIVGHSLPEVIYKRSPVISLPNNRPCPVEVKKSYCCQEESLYP